MKSYLQGNPEIKLSLNDNLVLGRNSAIQSNAIIDDYNFHECVNASEFEMNKVVRIRPPEGISFSFIIKTYILIGEFVAMNYRVTGEFEAPFRFFAYIDEISNYKLELNLRLKATFPKEYAGNNVTIKFAVPRQNSNVYTELPKVLINFKFIYNSYREYKDKKQNFKLLLIL